MRKEEEVSAEVFKKHLQKEYSEVNYRSGNDPPDIIFEIDGSIWAVEHTRLFEHIDKNGKSISRIGIDKPLLNLEKRLNIKLNKNLNSSWIISIESPIKNKEMNKVENRILEEVQKKLAKSFFNHSNGKVYIEKINQKNNQILIISIPAASSKIPQSDKLSCDIQGQIDFALKKILNDKCEKMDRLTNFDRKILLIQNQYFFTTKENIMKSLHKGESQIWGIDEIWLLNSSEIYRLY